MFKVIRFASLIVFFVLSTSVLAEEEIIPIDDFFGKSTDFQHVLSPSGKYLAFIVDHPTTYTLDITDLDTSTVIYSTRISGKYPRELTWLSERRLMYKLGGRIHAINPDGTDSRTLISNIHSDEYGKVKSIKSLKKNFRYWTVENVLPDNDEEILVSSTNIRGNESVHKINVFTGEKTDLYDGDKFKIQGWMLDYEGKVKLAIRSKRDNAKFFEFSEEENSLIKIDAKEKLKFDFSGKTFIGNRAFPLVSSYEKDEIYVIENTNSDRFSLVAYNFKTNERRTILADEKYDVGHGDNLPGLIFDHENKKLVGVRYHRDKMTTVWFDEKFKKLQARLDARYPGQVNLILQWTKNMERVLFRSFNEKFFNKVGIYMPKTKKVVIQTLGAPGIDKEKLAETKSIIYKSSDGHDINAYLTLPIGKEKNVPLIVMPHGGPFARSYPGYNAYVQYFASRGYGIIKPDFRGSTSYGREHLLGGKGGIHDVMIDDIYHSAKWAIDEGIADPKRVHILGFSYGGYAAVMSAIKYPEFYHSAVSYAAPLDLKKQLKWYKKQDSYFAYEYWKEMVFEQKASSKRIKELSPFYQLKNITIPVEIFHGDRDPVVPQVHAEAFKKEVKKQKKSNVKVTIFNDERHGIYLKSNKIYFAEKALKLFSKEAK